MPEDSAQSGLLNRFPALAKLALGRRRRIPYVQQTAAADCAAACLAMTLAYHGKEVRLDDVRGVSGISQLGTNALTLIRTARWFGLRGRGVTIEDLDDLQYLERGSILHWAFNHFVVFDRMVKGGAEIIDPEHGRRLVSHKLLNRDFTGVALTFEPDDDFEPAATKGEGIWYYLKQILSQTGVLSQIIVTSVLIQVLVLAVPILTSLLVDRVVPRGDYHLLTVVSAGIAGIVLAHFFSSVIRAYLLLQLRTQLDARLTLDFLDHLVDLPYVFFQQRSAGDLMARLNSNTTVREILTSSALSGALDGVLVVSYLVMMLVISPKMGLVVCALGLMRLSIFALTRRRYQDLMSEALQIEAKSRNYQVEIFSGIETLKATGTEKRAVSQWSNLFVDELNVSVSRGRLSAFIDSILEAMQVASPLIILAVGGYEVLDGNLTLGTMLAINALAASFLNPLSTLINTAFQLQLLRSYLERINDVLEAPKEQERLSEAPGDGTEVGARRGPESQPKAAITPAPELRGEIGLERVSFRYSALSQLVLENVSLEIQPGQFVAIVGRSGAGKSTLANLLLGLYPPSEGRIFFDGHDLARLELRSVRSQLGIVTQFPYFFADTMRANISLIDPTLPIDRVIEAAEMAQIHEDIRLLPMGYETLLAAGGGSFSGGQRQRLAIARALVHKPAILLLDEATSHLDAVTEMQIHRVLRTLDATRIVIAHRLSTVKVADLIVVLEDGKVTEKGSHAELVTRGGTYAELVAAQLEDGKD